MVDDNTDFGAVLAEELNQDAPQEEATKPEPEAETPPEPNKPESEKKPVDGDPTEEEPTPPADGDDPVKEGEKPVEEEAPKFATKSDVIDAMREYNQQTTERVSTINNARDEIIKVIHPEGIDKNIYDTNGNVIKTAQDIVDRELLNPKTNEPFTYEQAASWLMDSQRQMNENVEELMSFAENLAETNISLSESNHQVMEKWGDVLNAMPNVAKELAENYVKTIEFDKTGSYVVKAPIDPMTFYSMALAPYMQLAETMGELENMKASTVQQEQEAERDERISLPQRGTSKVKANTGDPMLDALMDELES